MRGEPARPSRGKPYGSTDIEAPVSSPGPWSSWTIKGPSAVGEFWWIPVRRPAVWSGSTTRLMRTWTNLRGRSLSPNAISRPA